MNSSKTFSLTSESEDNYSDIQSKQSWADIKEETEEYCMTHKARVNAAHTTVKEAIVSYSDMSSQIEELLARSDPALFNA